jgi:hypothetical protein
VRWPRAPSRASRSARSSCSRSRARAAGFRRLARTRAIAAASASAAAARAAATARSTAASRSAAACASASAWAAATAAASAARRSSSAARGRDGFLELPRARLEIALQLLGLALEVVGALGGLFLVGAEASACRCSSGSCFSSSASRSL